MQAAIAPRMLAPPAAESSAGCPVCNAPSVHQLPVAGWGEMRRCPGCGLIFAHPLTLDETSQGLFARAYSGREARAGMEMFHQRLVWRGDLLGPEKAFEAALAQTQHRALAYIRENVQAGSLVLDIGCGSGLFLEAARRRGYAVAGIEVAGPAVDFLKGEGYQVFHGTVEEVPEGWARPSVCTAFYVLHHVSDPLAFFETVRRKFAGARLVLTEHYFGEDPKKLTTVNLPPRRLTVWRAGSLRHTLEKAGFRVELMDIVRHQPWHPMLDGSLTRLYCRARNLIPAGLRPHLIATYIRAQGLAFRLARAVAGNHSWSGQEHLMAIARPNGDS